MSSDVVIRSGDRYHRGVRSGTAVLTAESCNLDQASDLEIVEALPPDVPHDALCKRCMTPPQEE